MNEYLPKKIGISKSLRNEITTIFQLSNKVVETSFETLLKGNIQTTFGTDFNCIAQSILERGYDKAVIITDGYATIKPENIEKLRRHKLGALTVLFGGKDECPELEAFGSVVQLEDVIK